MKFTIVINQKAVIDSGLGLDIIDLAIFDTIKDFAHSGNCKTKYDSGKTYYLFSWKLIVKQLPVVMISTRQGVYNRMKNLETKKIISPHPDNQVQNESWYCFDENYSYLLYQPDNNPLQGRQGSLTPPDNGGLHNNSISNNTISKNTGPDKPASQGSIEKSIRERQISFLKQIIDWVLENPRKYPKLMYVEFAKYWVEPSTQRKKVKLRYEEQRFFDLGRRLSTWFQKSKDELIREYWEKEEQIETLNNLFKKQIL